MYRVKLYPCTADEIGAPLANLPERLSHPQHIGEKFTFQYIIAQAPGEVNSFRKSAPDFLTKSLARKNLPCEGKKLSHFIAEHVDPFFGFRIEANQHFAQICVKNLLTVRWVVRQALLSSCGKLVCGVACTEA